MLNQRKSGVEDIQVHGYWEYISGMKLNKHMFVDT